MDNLEGIGFFLIKVLQNDNTFTVLWLVEKSAFLLPVLLKSNSSESGMFHKTE